MSNFRDIQYGFSEFIRDPENQPLPENIEPRRMAVYAELFYNNIDGFVSSAFPVLKSLIDEQQWHQMIRHFFVHHNCETPLFLEISAEFLTYLQRRLISEPDFAEQLPEFTLELAHYEWMELVISIREEKHGYVLLEDISNDANLVFSETAALLSYQYPVQHISTAYQPQQPGNETTFIVIYRDVDDEVQFLAVNALTAHLLELLNDNPLLRFEDYIDKIQASLPQIPQQQIVPGAMTTIKRLAQLGIIRTTAAGL